MLNNPQTPERLRVNIIQKITEIGQNVFEYFGKRMLPCFWRFIIKSDRKVKFGQPLFCFLKKNNLILLTSNKLVIIIGSCSRGPLIMLNSERDTKALLASRIFFSSTKT